MNKAEKIQFIRNLTDSVTQSIIEKVDSIPEHWDGHELRRYIADKFDDQNLLLASGRIRANRQTKRLAAYRNDVATRNL